MFFISVNKFMLASLIHNYEVYFLHIIFSVCFYNVLFRYWSKLHIVYILTGLCHCYSSICAFTNLISSFQPFCKRYLLISLCNILFFQIKNNKCKLITAYLYLFIHLPIIKYKIDTKYKEIHLQLEKIH